MAQIKKDTSLRKAILQAAITGQLISMVVETVENTIETGKQLLNRIIEDKNNPGPDGDGIILSFRSNQLFAIQSWVWQWADLAWPIEPKELVDNWKERREKINKIQSL